MTLYNSFIEELPLILFTVVAQAAVGFSLLYAVNNANNALEDRSYKRFGIVFITFVVFAMIASIFHLGDPLHIPYMITRIFGFTQNGEHVISWLPLEIVGIGLMLFIGLIVFLKGNKTAIYLLPIAGLAMLYAMGNIYGSMENTIPTWDLKLTILLFFASALFLGSIAYIAFIAKSQKEHKTAMLLAVIGFIFFVLALVLYTSYLGNLRIDAVSNVFDLANGDYALFIGLGIVLCGASLALLSIKANLSKMAFLLALIGLFLTRIVFYGLITSHLFIG
ncbi:hypothetical protein CRV00_09995 [Malaciobacter molluscorum]|uniref:dimethyl sulfoxide reductase anchor subunit family protein n=1 Tax=Malaciobacter molluscorum TaxID=1032072 RepID=UPI00100A6B2E|nr:DmsC/YnfH family molybdoenzyme membrane anchor subunit [Malaciobacter molluscorum]RXJ93783.1 hypothetical protein CRV00_09995 [Malaciobacter molluscorum]